MVTVGYVGHYGVQQKPRIVSHKKCRRLALDESIEAPFIENKVILVRILIEGGVLGGLIFIESVFGDAEHQHNLRWRTPGSFVPAEH